LGWISGEQRMLHEGDSEQFAGIRAESENEQELRQVLERIRSIPDKFDTLQNRVRGEMLDYLEKQGAPSEKEFWALFERDRVTLRPRVYYDPGETLELKDDQGNTLRASKQRLKEIEELRDRFTEGLRPRVYAELAKAPFISVKSPEMRASWRACPECGKRIKPQWHMIVKNSKEYPIEIDEVDPYWNNQIAMGKRTIPQQYRIIDNSELHDLQEHPSNSHISTDDWKAFLTPE
jgi:hypothetical protein